MKELQYPLERGREHFAPIVDHAAAARHSLAAYRSLKERQRSARFLPYECGYGEAAASRDRLPSAPPGAVLQ